MSVLILLMEDRVQGAHDHVAEYVHTEPHKDALQTTSVQVMAHIDHHGVGKGHPSNV